MPPTELLPDLYQVLGISSHAGPDEIRTAYRALARRFHPDANSNPGAASQFKSIAAAYEILNAPLERNNYDEKRKKNQDGSGYLTLRVMTSQRSLMQLDEPQVLYVLAELLPDRAQVTQKTETRLNLALVLDHSTSMNGPRLDRLKVAAYQIVEQLTEEDIFSVIGFSDEAEVLVPASTLRDKPGARARIAIMQAFGGTEIYQGLRAGLNEVRRYIAKKYVNHIILLTDGRTFGDEEQALELADKAAKDGISISAMGLGDEWNDTFLDQIASRTGGTSEYINSPMAVVKFLNDRVRALGQAYAERLKLSIAPDSDIKLESAFRLTPSPQPVDVGTDPILLGPLQIGGTASAILQLQLGSLNTPGPRSVARIEATGDILRAQRFDYSLVHDLIMEVTPQPTADSPPLAIVEALNRLSLYRIQEKAEQALARGDVQEATHHLETLATRLLAAGQTELAQAALSEARRVASTNTLSGEGQKSLKYGTRFLLAAKSAVGSGPETTAL
jgi:Ca-activated chloride channel family protein